MADRTSQQKIGALGQRLMMLLIEEHPDWLARELNEDYGIDIEAERTDDGVRGEILKIQIKSTKVAPRNNGKVRFVVERKYVEYAYSCRFPVIVALVEIDTKYAWYLWLQDWLLRNFRSLRHLDPDQSSWVVWVPESQTVETGLSGELKNIASWKGEAQLTLSIIDALRTAVASHNSPAIDALVNVISLHEPSLADISLDAIIDEAIVLGDKMRGTLEGNVIATHLFELVRKFGHRISQSTVRDLVIRDDSFSRTGIIALGILYDEFSDHMKSLQLPSFFLKIEPRVAYYCAFREHDPTSKSVNPYINPKDFTFAGLKYVQPDMFWDKYANRGPSALLDYLVPLNNHGD